MAEAFKTAPTRIESRLTGPLVADRGVNSCLPLPRPLGALAQEVPKAKGSEEDRRHQKQHHPYRTP